MNANMPTIQLLGSAVGAVNTASPASATSGAKSPFAAVMSGILGQPAGETLVSTTANSSESVSTTGSNISFIQLQQLSPELAAALNGNGSVDGLAALAGKLAALLNEMGEGKLVPLSADFDLNQLVEAGIELPEGLESALQGGQAVILVDQNALKELLAGGGWKEGMSVPVMLMAENGDSEQPGVVLIDSMLEAVKQTDDTTGKTSLQFQLSFDPSTTINLDAAEQTPVAAAAQDAGEVIPAGQLAGLVDAIALLKSVAEAGEDESSGEAGQVSEQNPAEALAAILGHKPAAVADDSDSESGEVLAVSEVDEPVAVESSGPAPQAEADEATEEKTRELAEKINELISALLGAAGRERPSGAQPMNNIDRIAAALEMVAGQVVSPG